MVAKVAATVDALALIVCETPPLSDQFANVSCYGDGRRRRRWLGVEVAVSVCVEARFEFDGSRRLKQDRAAADYVKGAGSRDRAVRIVRRRRARGNRQVRGRILRHQASRQEAAKAE